MFSNIIHSVHSIHRFHSWADEEKKLGALFQRPFTPSRASTDYDESFKIILGIYVLKHHPQRPQYPQIPQLGWWRKKIGGSFWDTIHTFQSIQRLWWGIQNHLRHICSQTSSTVSTVSTDSTAGLMKKKNWGLFLRDHSHLPEHPQTMMRDSKSF